MIWIWTGFILGVLFLLVLDVAVLHRRPHVMRLREALAWSAAWIALAMAFNVWIYFAYQNHWGGLGLPSRHYPHGLSGIAAATLFLTGYVVEESLSVDNLFVMALIFTYFRIPAIYQHRVLFWGILSVLLLRGAMIGIGTALVSHFEWVLYLFGLFLLFAAWKMLFSDAHADPQKSRIVRWINRIFAVTPDLHSQHFLVRSDDASPSHKLMGRWRLTPLALTLAVIETTDLVFAVDSIPAIFAITTDSFLVFTSNVFAVLGLRALYFALAGVLEKFRYLKVSLAAVLAVVGIKMLAKEFLEDIPGISFYMLGLVALILAAGVVASLLRPLPASTQAPPNRG